MLMLDIFLSDVADDNDHIIDNNYWIIGNMVMFLILYDIGTKNLYCYYFDDHFWRFVKLHEIHPQPHLGFGP